MFSVRSERAFCEELDYNLLFRWFLGMQLMERSFDPTVFTKHRRLLLEHQVGSSCSTRRPWRRTGEVITSEYSIGYGRGVAHFKKADYALHPTGQKGTPIAFIEAKRLREALSDEHLDQALKTE